MNMRSAGGAERGHVVRKALETVRTGWARPQTSGRKGTRRRAFLIAAVAVGLGALLFAGVERFAFNRELSATMNRARGTLTLAATALDGRLGRFRSLPELIAGEDPVAALLNDPADPALRAQVDRYFRHIARILGASVVYLMGMDGQTIAASNYRTPVSFVGKNFSFRPYFKEALRTGRGQFFALGTTSGRRGFYVSSAVKVLGRVRGVVVFKVDLAPIEASWRGNSHDEIVVTDPAGVIFLSSRRDWLYHSFHPLAPAQLAGLRASRRYDRRRLRALPIRSRSLAAGGELIAMTSGGARRQYAVVTRAMPDAGWTVRVLADAAPAHARAGMAALMTLLMVGLIALATIIAWRERSRLAERLRIQRIERGRLERRVGERTRDLAHANRQLEAEVAERRATEHRLRKTQADLIQASKLAALGQMSAALSHEFNQPLAALSVYAENAETCLDRARPDLVRDNLGRMSRLIARLASLSGHLHSFARKPGERLRPVELRASIDAVLDILARRIEGLGAEIAVAIAPGAERVIAGEVRLQQVLLNIVANALDVIEAGAPARIAITASPSTEGRVLIRLRDWGPGISESTAERLFDPFFTTKGPGKGLGMGLSISYNIVKDFGGLLSARNAGDGGACFTLELDAPPPAPPIQPAAPRSGAGASTAAARGTPPGTAPRPAGEVGS